jgi:O-methyltransferase
LGCDQQVQRITAWCSPVLCRQRGGAWKDFEALVGFLAGDRRELSLMRRVALTRRLRAISRAIDCPHTESEILSYVRCILALDPAVPGCVVEAGCYKGGSTAKFSIAAKMAGRKLVVFDSFQGIPKHNEDHGTNIFGKPVTFVALRPAGGRR